MAKDLITVTSPLLPNLDEFHEMLKEIWASKWITNNGSFHKQLEAELAKYLKVPYVSLFTMVHSLFLQPFRHFESPVRLSQLHIVLLPQPTQSGGMDASLYLWTSLQRQETLIPIR